MLLGGQPFVANHVKDRCLIMVDRPQQDVMHWTLYISMEPGVWVSRYVHVIYDHICYTYSYILSCIRQNCTQVCFNMLQLYQTGSRSGLGGFVRVWMKGLLEWRQVLGRNWEKNGRQMRTFDIWSWDFDLIIFDTFSAWMTKRALDVLCSTASPPPSFSILEQRQWRAWCCNMLKHDKQTKKQ